MKTKFFAAGALLTACLISAPLVQSQTWNGTSVPTVTGNGDVGVKTLSPQADVHIFRTQECVSYLNPKPMQRWQMLADEECESIFDLEMDWGYLQFRNTFPNDLDLFTLHSNGTAVVENGNLGVMAWPSHALSRQWRWLFHRKRRHRYYTQHQFSKYAPSSSKYICW